MDRKELLEKLKLLLLAEINAFTANYVGMDSSAWSRKRNNLIGEILDECKPLPDPPDDNAKPIPKR